MRWWTLLARGRPSRPAGPARPPQPTLADLGASISAVQADVRRLGAALVRAEAAAQNASRQVEALGAELRDELDRLRRQQAELAASPSRAAEARAQALLPFLDLADSMARAAAAVAEWRPAAGEAASAATAAWASAREEFVDVLGRLVGQLARILQASGLRPVAGPGLPFDPRVHRAVGSVQRAGLEGRVVLVDRQGYLLDGSLLRPAEVWVGAAAEAGGAPLPPASEDGGRDAPDAAPEREGDHGAGDGSGGGMVGAGAAPAP